jgi:hypothetical protein
MTQQDIINPNVVTEVKDCFLCKEKLTDNRHVTCNFSRDVGKFTIEYLVVCEKCTKLRKWEVMMLGKGSMIFPQPSLC